MSPNTTKQELLQRLRAGYDQFQQIIRPLSPTQLTTPGIIGAWSIKDTIAHFVVHEQFALRELTAARNGQKYQNPFPDSDTMNTASVADAAHQSLERVLRDWDSSFRAVVAAVESLADHEFSESGDLVRWLDDTIDGALANNTYEHYAEHEPAIRAWIAKQPQQ